MSDTIRVYSIRQPLASELITGGRDGIRDVLNSSREVTYRGEVLIHAFHAMHDGTHAYYPSGVIIGRVRIVDCLPPDRRIGDWHATGKWGIYLTGPVPFPHIPHPGHPDERLPPCAFTVDLDRLLPGKAAWQWYTDWLDVA